MFHVEDSRAQGARVKQTPCPDWCAELRGWVPLASWDPVLPCNASPGVEGERGQP